MGVCGATPLTRAKSLVAAAAGFPLVGGCCCGACSGQQSCGEQNQEAGAAGHRQDAFVGVAQVCGRLRDLVDGPVDGHIDVSCVMGWVGYAPGAVVVPVQAGPGDAAELDASENQRRRIESNRQGGRTFGCRLIVAQLPVLVVTPGPKIPILPDGQ